MRKHLHPGEHVRDILIDGAGLTVTEASERLGITRTSLSRLINGHTGITPEMALRLSTLLGTSIEMWLNLQMHYDVWVLKKANKQISVLPLKEAA
ncbi:MAG: HigA family addiction module antidote protein [Gammaproteobacteria bacterium]|nr:HigA family addiction module antidote protein [Gammaproteobacteria bacterium]